MLFIGCDENVSYAGASDAITGTYLNTGTCTYSLQTVATPPVVIDSGTLSYVAASNGNYLGIIDAAITGALTNGQTYNVVVTFAQGNYNDQQRVQELAGYRMS